MGQFEENPWEPAAPDPQPQLPEQDAGWGGSYPSWTPTEPEPEPVDPRDGGWGGSFPSSSGDALDRAFSRVEEAYAGGGGGREEPGPPPMRPAPVPPLSLLPNEVKADIWSSWLDQHPEALGDDLSALYGRRPEWRNEGDFIGPIQPGGDPRMAPRGFFGNLLESTAPLDFLNSARRTGEDFGRFVKSTQEIKPGAGILGDALQAGSSFAKSLFPPGPGLDTGQSEGLSFFGQATPAPPPTSSGLGIAYPDFSGAGWGGSMPEPFRIKPRQPDTSRSAVATILDYAGRPSKAMAGAFMELHKDVNAGSPFVLGEYTAAFTKALRGEGDVTYYDVFRAAGYSDEMARGLGFGADLLADPMNLIPLNVVGKPIAFALKVPAAAGRFVVDHSPAAKLALDALGELSIKHYSLINAGFKDFANGLEVLERSKGVMVDESVKTAQKYLGGLNQAGRDVFFAAADEGLAAVAKMKGLVGPLLPETVLGSQRAADAYMWYVGTYRPALESVKASMGLTGFLPNHIRHIFPNYLQTPSISHPIRMLMPGSFKHRTNAAGYLTDPVLSIALDRAEVYADKLLNTFVEDTLATYGHALAKGATLAATPGFDVFYPRIGPKAGQAWELPAEIVQSLNTYLNPRQAALALRAYDAILGIWKGTVTSLFPVYHLRNEIGNLHGNWIAGVTDPISYLEGAAVQDYLRRFWAKGSGLSGMTKAVFTDKIAERAVKRMGLTLDQLPELERQMNLQGVLNSGFFSKDVMESLRATGALGSAGEAFGKGALGGFAYGSTVVGATTMNPVLSLAAGAVSASVMGAANVLARYGRTVGEALENNAKWAHVIGRSAMGDTIDAAMASAKKYLFDYGNLSPFEQAVAKRFIPFYTWMRHNTPLMVEALVSGKPGKVFGMKMPTFNMPATIEKTRRNVEMGMAQAGGYQLMTPEEEKRLPDYIAEALNIQVGWKTDERGERRPVMVSGFQIPFEDINRFFRETPQRTLQALARDVTPLLKVPAEYHSDWSSLTFKPITDPSTANFYKRVFPIIAEIPVLKEWLGVQKIDRSVPGGTRTEFVSSNPLNTYLFQAILGRILTTASRAAKEDTLGEQAGTIVTPWSVSAPSLMPTEEEAMAKALPGAPVVQRPDDNARAAQRLAFEAGNVMTAAGAALRGQPAPPTPEFPPGLPPIDPYRPPRADDMNRWNDEAERQIQAYKALGNQMVNGRPLSVWSTERYEPYRLADEGKIDSKTAQKQIDAWVAAHPQEEQAVQDAERARIAFKAQPANWLATDYIDWRGKDYDLRFAVSQQPDSPAMFQAYFGEVMSGTRKPWATLQKYQQQGAGGQWAQPQPGGPTSQVVKPPVNTPAAAAAESGMPNATEMAQRKGVIQDQLDRYPRTPANLADAEDAYFAAPDRKAWAKTHDAEMTALQRVWKEKGNFKRDPANADATEFLDRLKRSGLDPDQQSAVNDALNMGSLDRYVMINVLQGTAGAAPVQTAPTQTTQPAAPTTAAQQSISTRAAGATNVIGLDDQSKFIAQLLPYAKQFEGQTGIPASWAIAMWINESGYDISHAAPFGIKGTSPSGTSSNYDTWEDYGQGRVDIKDTFATYNTPAEAFQHLAQNMMSEKYAGAPKTSPGAFAQYLVDHGPWATDPQYAAKINRIVGDVERKMGAATTAGNVPIPAGARTTGTTSVAMGGPGRAPTIPNAAKPGTGIPGTTQYYQVKGALQDQIDVYYGFGTERERAIAAFYGELDTNQRKEWRGQNAAAYKEMTNYYDQRDALLEDPQFALAAEYLDFLDSLGGKERRDAIEQQLGGISSVEWFLQARSMGLTKPKGALAPGAASMSAAKPATGGGGGGGGGGGKPKASPPANNTFAAFHNDALSILGDLESYWRSRKPLSASALALLRTLFAKHPLGAMSFEEWLDTILPAAWRTFLTFGV